MLLRRGKQGDLKKRRRRLVYICDWLPPDFGAVGQYAVMFAGEWAKSGWAVTLVGLTSGESRREAAESIGSGTLEVVRVHRAAYEKRKFVDRLIWTISSNLLLVRAAFSFMRKADAVLFTGSPPLLLHFIGPLNLIIRTKLIYRITDFHPECFIAEQRRLKFFTNLLLRLTCFWRRRVDIFEVLGMDQARRLANIGIPEGRMYLKRDPSPVVFLPQTPLLLLPESLRGASGVILYSGNWGIAHDEDTFVEAYSQYFRQSRQPLRFWLNAVGSKAHRVETELRRRGVFVYRTSTVPLGQLPALLLAADVHLITLHDAFVGYVVPSKVYACIQSGRRIIFVGSEASDVNLVASRALPAANYRRVDVGDVDGLIDILHHMEWAVIREKKVQTKNGVIASFL